jgi:transcriptional regulator with XRE-family HTH domain
MEYVQKIRQDYSLSQNELARFLGVHRSSLSMGESGRRSILSRQTIVRIDALIDAMEAAEVAFENGEKLEPTAAERDELRKGLERECSTLRRKLYMEERKLEELEEARNRAQKSIIGLRKMEKREDLFPKMSLDAEWIMIQIRTQEQILRRIPKINIIQSKARIASINEELRLLELEIISISA